MIKIFILVVAFGGPFVCPEEKLQNRPLLCKADAPVVAFYWDQDKAIRERDAMLGKVDAARLFEIDLQIYRALAWHEDKEYGPEYHNRITVKELTTAKVEQYVVQAATVTVTP